MSLLVWLPLDGDTHNQGIAPWNFSVSNTSMITVDNSGKIGKCYNFNSTAANNGIYSADNGFMETYINNKSWSICAWVCTSSTDTCVISLSYGLRIFCGNSTYVSLYNSSRTVTCTSSVAVKDGKWHHICATYDKDSNIITFYVDGVSTKTTSYTSGYIYASSWTNGLFIGRDPNNSTVNDHYLYKGKMNDLRIYGKALSAAEVKEISQGLILHYKLDASSIYGNKNIVGAARYSQTSATGGTWGAHRYISTQVDLDPSIPVPWHKGTKFELIYDTSLGSGGGGSCSIGQYATTGSTTYCYSLYIQAPDDMAYINGNWMYRYEYDSSNTKLTEVGVAAKSRAIPLGNHWYRIWGTFTTQANTVKTTFSFFTYPNKTITYYFCCPQVELGQVMTAWNNGSETECIIDSSGYNHNGWVSGSSLVSTSSRYSAAMACNGTTVDSSSNTLTGAKYFFSNLPLTTPSALTVTWWGKNDAYGRGGIFETTAVTFTSSNGMDGTDYSTTAISNWDSTFRVYNGSSAFNFFSSFVKDGAWHHHAIVFDAVKAYYYCDGALVTSGALTGTLPTFYGIRMGLGRAGGVYRQIKETVSDLRIYVTALAADDIKSLYNVGASIDNKGSLHAHELVETQTNVISYIEYLRLKKTWGAGLGSYTQSNCQVSLTNDGYRVYRPPNLTTSNNGNTMWGGLKLVNQTSDTVQPYSEPRDNAWGLQKGHTYIVAMHAHGQTSNATSFGFANNMGWDGGGVKPAPTIVLNVGLPTDFNGDKECFCIFTINDDISKKCTSAYSSYQANQYYLSYRHITFGWGYSSTGALGTDVYFTNFRLYDITSYMGNFNKKGQANFHSFIEQLDNCEIKRNSEILSTEFIER